ncbi:DUF4974 domain-containing protein [Hymenobacter setariae]|uniref:DUF4974 domain-containing protein n=1 Tax=Hymenobacter setariae TaxID=2594794 RepID=A0A558BYL1_9BACT|nr:FecR domain-containing protein [Hymenobacter setariae]TVT41596.1 DUF4974 domain-containing protein [Hymenobacter setariae]
MTESDFEAIHQRYLDGTSRPGERELIEQWSRQLGSPENVTLPRDEHEQVRTAMWRQIEVLARGASAADNSRVLQHPASFWRMPMMRWAAAVLLLVGATLAVLLPQRRQTHTAALAWVQQQNAGQQPQVITLADHSRVTLYPGSSLQYRTGLLGARREVRLKGEAFFQVAKNPARPFLVYTEQLVTTVLGTSFRVKAYLGRPNEVAVQEGRVSVQLRHNADLSATPVQPAAEGVLLLPNQQVAYSALAPRSLQKKLVANPIVVAPQVFTFEKQPVIKVLQSLEKAYGVTILYDKNKLASCTITVTFYQESLYEKLDMLSQALGASYSSVDNAQIRFRSNGCAL